MKEISMREFAEFSSLETQCLQPKQKRIGLLGGTFNPVHNGHLQMAYIALYEFLLGEIVFLPLHFPPHKKDEYIAPVNHRMQMLHLALAGESRFSISTLETERTGITYTVDTLELLSRGKCDVSYYYIIGADTLMLLETWRSIERVIFLTDFICIFRPGQDTHSAQKHAEKLNNYFGHKIHFAREYGPDISSSQVRLLAEKNRMRSGLVPDCVSNYMLHHRVYTKEA